MLIVLTAVNDEQLYDELAQNIARHSTNFRMCAARGAESIAAGYNRLVAESHSAVDDVLCFIHQDARLHFDAAAVVPQYLTRLSRPGVLGFCGSRAQRPGLQWHACPPCVGELLQGRAPAEALVFDPPTAAIDGLRYAEVHSVDGYCLFVLRRVFDQIGGFDEDYRGWHGYDLDLCMRARRYGFQNYVIGQPSQHFSWGTVNQDLRDSLELFGHKWSDALAHPANPAPRVDLRDHALRALEQNPYDERLIENYHLVEDLTARAEAVREPPLVDVVILSCANTRKEYEMTKRCIRSLRASSPDIATHIVVVETNGNLRAESFAQETDLFGPHVAVVFPGGRFAYNVFLHAGYEACGTSPAKYFMSLNNDVTVFAPGFLVQMLAALATVDSVSPLGLREVRWGFIDPAIPINMNYDINHAVCGWCLLFDKRILASAGFSTYFPPELIWYCQDVHYAETLRAYGYRHGLVTAAKALHLQGKSHHLLGENLVAPASRINLLHDLGMRHKRCVVVDPAAVDFIDAILSYQPAQLLLVMSARDGSCGPMNELVRSNDRLEIVTVPSTVAAQHRADASLDFVYLDGSHPAEALDASMRAWWAKLRPSGWLAGYHYEQRAVQSIVTRVCRELHIPLAFVTRDEPSTWAIQVPR